MAKCYICALPGTTYGGHKYPLCNWCRKSYGIEKPKPEPKPEREEEDTGPMPIPDLTPLEEARRVRALDDKFNKYMHDYFDCAWEAPPDV